jgi:hypothetical protein
MKIAVTLFPIAGALLLTSSALFAQTAPWEDLIATARKGSTTPGLKDVITKTLSAHGGNAIWGQDYRVWLSYWTLTVKPRGQPYATGEE